MSFHEISLLTVAGEHSLVSSESETDTGIQNTPHGKTAQVYKSFTAWRFCECIRADVLDGSLDDRKEQLIGFLRTRTAHNRPFCVRSVTIFADLNQFVSAQPGEIPTDSNLSIPIVGYVQTNKSRTLAMTTWLPTATWNPVSGGLHSDSKFLADLDRANNPTMPGWCNLPIFGELGLNNQGRIAASKERKVFAHFHIDLWCGINSYLPSFPFYLPTEDG